MGRSSLEALNPFRRVPAPASAGVFLLAVGALNLLLAATPVMAEDVVLRCAPTFVDRPAALDWSVTGVSQASNDDAADPDATGSFDAVGHMRAGPGFLFVQAEGSTGENRGRVSGQFPLSNADAATAVDEDGDGRVQLSQVNYTLVNETFEFATGLLDPSCYLDFSDIANDETRDFLAQPFTNNLAIAFPDYTLGGAVHLHLDQALGLTLFLSSSNGLGDNDKASYSNLVDITESGKGAFAAAELTAHGALNYRLGVWVNSRDFENLDNPDDTDNDYGIYGSLESDARPLRWNIRIGAANPNVSETAGFAAATMTFPLGEHAAGLAVSYQHAADDLDGDSDYAVFTEALLHIDVGEKLRFTPLLQWTHNDSFTSNDALIAGLRVTYASSH